METSTVLAIGLLLGVPLLAAAFIANEARRTRVHRRARAAVRRRRARSKKHSRTDS